METSQTAKQFSVVIKLDKFEALNGELLRLNDDQERHEYISQFFLSRFGEGGGKLQIVQKKSKIKLTWLPPRVDAQAEALHKEALSNAKNKKYKEAINKWIKAITMNPTDPDYYFNLGIAFFEIKNYKESIENLRKAISLCPIYFKTHLILGTVYLKTRQFDQAETHLKESIVYYPEHSLAYLNLGAVYSILKRYEEGIKMFLKTIELSPKEIRAHFGLAKIYSIQGSIDLANQYYKNVIEIGTNPQLIIHAKRSMVSLREPDTRDTSEQGVPTNIERYYQDGYRAYLFTDYDKAIRMYSEYLKYKRKDDFVWFSLGEALLRAGHVLKAVEAFQNAVNLNHSKALYYKELALAFDCLNKGNEVVEQVNKALKHGKDDGILLTLYAKYLIKAHKYDEAIEKLEKALKNSSNNLLAKFYLALALKGQNDMDSAINYLQQIMKAPINSPIKMEAESLLSDWKT